MVLFAGLTQDSQHHMSTLWSQEPVDHPLILFICEWKPKQDSVMALVPDWSFSDTQEELLSESRHMGWQEFTPEPLRSHMMTTNSSSTFKDAAWAYGGIVRYKGGSCVEERGAGEIKAGRGGAPCWTSLSCASAKKNNKKTAAKNQTYSKVKEDPVRAGLEWKCWGSAHLLQR